MRTLRWYVANPDHGPLPGLLLLMTVSTGIIDAVSILGLGRVFVANMTGNVVFSALALAGASGFSLAASVVALAGFLVGASAGGQIVRASGGDRGRLLRRVAAIELVLIGSSLAVAAGVGGSRPRGGTADAVAGLLAVAMGLQNTMARHLAVPDLTTTVLTMTLTGFAADLRAGNHAVALRRLLAVAAMLLGALGGGLLLVHGTVARGLVAGTGLMAVIAAGAFAAARGDGPWRHRPR